MQQNHCNILGETKQNNNSNNVKKIKNKKNHMLKQQSCGGTHLLNVFLYINTIFRTVPRNCQKVCTEIKQIFM